MYFMQNRCDKMIFIGNIYLPVTGAGAVAAAVAPASAPCSCSSFAASASCRMSLLKMSILSSAGDATDEMKKNYFIKCISRSSSINSQYIVDRV